MGHFQIKTTQQINASLEDVWDFISSPKNLKLITPNYMRFDLTSEVSEKMYPGMIISYKVSPMLNIPLTWVTEITHVKHLKYFVDEQRLGPYKMWHHQHHLEQNNQGVLMTDIVNYIPPFGFVGNIANSLFISKKLNEIFNYRRVAVDQFFK